MKTLNRIKGAYGTMYYVKNMAQSVAFFKQKLGLSPIFESPEWTEFAVNGHSLCLHIAGEKPVDRGVLILHVEDTRKAAAELKSAGVKVGEAHEVHPGAYSCDFEDVDGNLLNLYDGPKN